MIWTPGWPAHGFRLRRGRISLDPNPQLQPASRISQAPPCNVKRVWVTICYWMACRPLRHNRLAVNPLPVMVWNASVRRCVDGVAGLHGGAERTTGSLVVRDCPVSSVFCAICSCMPLLAQDLIRCVMSFQTGFGACSAVPLHPAVTRACPSGQIDWGWAAEAWRHLIFELPYLDGMVCAYGD